jgi:hypothetical protein
MIDSKVISRFWKYVKKGRGCWEWQGATHDYGYGVLNIRLGLRGDHYSCVARAHRISWEIHNGSIPEGFCVLHKCDNPPCVNPDHLWLGTKKDNTSDMYKKGRNRGNFREGECKAKRKLTEDQVRNIKRRLTGRRGEISSLAREHGVTIGAVWLIAKGKNWRTVHA